MRCVESTQYAIGEVFASLSNGKVTELAMNQWSTQFWLDLDNVTSLLAFLYQPVNHGKNRSSYQTFHSILNFPTNTCSLEKI